MQKSKYLNPRIWYRSKVIIKHKMCHQVKHLMPLPSCENHYYINIQHMNFLLFFCFCSLMNNLPFTSSSSFHLCFGHRSYKKLHNWLEWNVQIWIFLKRENAIEVIDNHSSPMYSCWKYPHNSISLSTIMHERRLIWHLNLLLPYIYNLLSFSFSFLEKKLLPIS